MADNTVLNSGSGGDTIASDEIALVKYQRVKIVEGADGVNDGDIASGNPLPVDVSDSATRDLGKLDVASLDQYVPIDVDSGAGTLNALPITWRKNSALGVEFGTATDPVRVDPTGTTAQPVTDNAGSLTIDNAALSVTGGGVEAGALRVTLASDSTGLVSVDDNAGSLTIDNATLAVTGGGVEAGALRVTLANDSTGVVSIDDNAGSLTVDQATASNFNAQVVGNIAHDTAASGNPVQVAGSHETIADTAPSNRLATVTDGDVQRLSTIDGAVFVIPSGPQQWKARLTGTMTDTTVKAAPASGLSLYITDVVYSIGAATASSILLEESTTTAVFGPHYLEAVNGRGLAVHLGTPIKITAATLLSATNSGSTTATLDVYGFTAPG